MKHPVFAPILSYFPVVALSYLAVACATTTIQSQKPENPDDEASFFQPLGENGKADGGTPDTLATDTDPDCACPLRKKNRASDGNKELVAAGVPDQEKSDGSYFNAADPGRTASEEKAVVPVTDAETVSGDFFQTGTASWYGRDFDGKKTANGEIFDSRKLTAAHRTLPLGSIVLVQNVENGKEIILTVNDRGPYIDGRILDVSEYGAELLGYKEKGLTTVGIKVVRKGKSKSGASEGATANFYRERNSSSSTGKSRYDEPATRYFDDPRELQGKRTGTRKRARLSPGEIKRAGETVGYSVQVGVFSQLQNAKQLRASLSQYKPVHIVQRGREYVVRVGSFPERYDAESMKYQLEADGYDGFVSGP